MLGHDPRRYGIGLRSLRRADAGRAGAAGQRPDEQPGYPRDQLAVASLLFINILGFAAAYALTQGIRGSNLYRTVFFMPNLIGGIVLGYIWSW